VELLHHVEAAYAVSEGIYPEGLELAIREILRDQTRRFIHVVRGSRKEKIADAVRPAPMTSLRDVDAGVSFQPASNTDWQELEHFRRA
jgi:hypothetical protein